MMESNTITNYL